MLGSDVIASSCDQKNTRSQKGGEVPYYCSSSELLKKASAAQNCF